MNRVNNPPDENKIYNQQGTDIVIRIDDISALSSERGSSTLYAHLTSGDVIELLFSSNEELSKDRKLIHSLMKKSR